MTKEFTTQRGRFIALSVPEGSNPTLIQSHSYFHSPRIEHGQGGIDLDNKYKYEFICQYPGCTEEIAQGIVESNTHPDENERPVTLYRNYKNNYFFGRRFDTALESLASLFESLDILFVNPYGEKEPDRYNIVDRTGTTHGCCVNVNRDGSCCENSIPEPYQYQDQVENEEWFIWAQAKSKVVNSVVILKREGGG